MGKILFLLLGANFVIQSSAGLPLQNCQSTIEINIFYIPAFQSMIVTADSKEGGVAGISYGGNATASFPEGISLYSQRPKNSQFEYFLSNVTKGDFDSNLDLDFQIITKQRPGQDHAIDDIQNQPFKFIKVYRKNNSDIEKTIGKIRNEINDIVLNNKPTKVLVFGWFRFNRRLFKGKIYGFLKLTQIEIFCEDEKKIYLIEGIRGGIIGNPAID